MESLTDVKDGPAENINQDQQLKNDSLSSKKFFTPSDIPNGSKMSSQLQRAPLKEISNFTQQNSLDNLSSINKVLDTIDNDKINLRAALQNSKSIPLKPL